MFDDNFFAPHDFTVWAPSSHWTGHSSQDYGRISFDFELLLGKFNISPLDPVSAPPYIFALDGEEKDG